MDRCKTCKHWNRSDKYTGGFSLGLGVCEATPMLWDSTKWSEEGDSRQFVDAAGATTAFAQDGSDYSAKIYTKPEHGCTMHESPNAEAVRPAFGGSEPAQG